jgi:hypothetical protein
MEKFNIGYANLCISDKLKESYFNSDLINESKNITDEFLKVLKNSPLLMLEFKVFNNIENKTIDNDTVCTRFIDNNIKLFETFTVDEIHEEHEKLAKFIIKDIKVDKEKEKLYNSITNLIVESVSSFDEIDVDDIHESFITVLNHLKKEKKKPILSETTLYVNKDVIEIAINKFNDRYSDLNEDDRKLIKYLINTTLDEKVIMFEKYKNIVLESVTKLNIDKYGDKINLAVNRINEMKTDCEIIDDNIIKLHELKMGFI